MLSTKQSPSHFAALNNVVQILRQDDPNRTRLIRHLVCVHSTRLVLTCLACRAICMIADCDLQRESSRQLESNQVRITLDNSGLTDSLSDGTEQ